MQGDQQSGRRNFAGIRRKHAWDVGPDLKASSLKSSGKIGGGSVRPAAAKQYGLAVHIPGNETLRHNHVRGCGQCILHLFVGRKITSRAQVVLGSLLPEPSFTGQMVARIHPTDWQPGRGKIFSTDSRGHNFAQRHNTNAHSNADLTHEADSCDQLFKFVQGLAKKFSAVELKRIG